MSIDYKNTVFLPSTSFPMKAGLPELEPKLLKRWQEIGLYKKMREVSKGREKFILHDGPPYANGHLHIGHALNKILKDVINRSQQMLGKDANYVPGWDCHGLPIEWKIEEKYRAKGQDKDQVPIGKFREECRAFAAEWIDIQREEFKRLGVEGDWENPYTTMSYKAEAAIAGEISKFALNGSLYRGAKPVMWSVVEKTALAEAEVEYHDHVSTMIWVKFPVIKPSLPELAGAKVVIWTTTPWTIPGNRAVAYGGEIDYVLVKLGGEKIVVAEALLPKVLEAAKQEGGEVKARFKGPALKGTVLNHPWHGQGYDFAVPMLEGDFVTTEQGTGFVHIAPGHGDDDWKLGMQYGIAVPDTVADDGTYFPHVPLFAGIHVFKADKPVLEALEKAGALLGHGKLTHSYPHSWRSKAPLIFRTTPQWFISMETTGLRKTALEAIDNTRFVPASGQNRLRGMIEARPDWCVSRQRAWGVPITVFVHKQSGTILKDEKVFARIIAAFEQEGADAWFVSPPERFLGPDYNPADYEQIKDILDVWFDSGSTHAFVLRQRPDLAWPASLYLEGSDQHRGWFHSSLLESCGTQGRAPYNAVLTHGFVMDEQGRKMSKSLGNVTSPQDVVSTYGADILRLWVMASDYSDDLRIGKEILKQEADVYRRLRNTFRYLLGSLEGFGEEERIDYAQMPELECWVLSRVSELDKMVRKSVQDFEFHGMFATLHNFCAVDLSAFYFDIRKDTLYCDSKTDVKRRAARTVMAILFDCLCKWLAPILCFTAEEAWLCRHSSSQGSVHLELFPEIPANWYDKGLEAKWEKIRDLRRVVTGALELERAAKKIGASLQANPQLYAPGELISLAQQVDMAEISITSAISLREANPPANAFILPDVPGVGVVVELAEGKKCVRCWKILPDVGSNPDHAGVCERCAKVVG